MKYKYQNKKCQICDGDYEPNSGCQKYCLGCGTVKKLQAKRKFCQLYYWKNKPKEVERKHIWYEKNKGRILQHQKDYRKNKCQNT